MKRKLLLTTLLLTIFTTLTPTITADAAYKPIYNKGNIKIWSFSICPPSSLPGIEIPEITPPTCNPETNNPIIIPPACKPESDKPVTTPPTNKPEVEKPETDKPVVAPPVNKPETEKPETDKPIVTPPVSKPEVEKPETEKPENDDINTSYVKQVVSLVNAERAKVGLSPLTLSDKVSAAANTRAKEIQSSFSHTRPNGSSFATALKEHNVSYKGAGENIAWGQKSPTEVVNAWMNSAGHRANILNAKYTTIGVGHTQNTKGTNYWCQLFTY